MSIITARSLIYNLFKNGRCLSTSKSRFDIVVVNEVKSGSSKQSNSGTVGDVPGLSSHVVAFGNDPVGSGASKTSKYKNPEYFSYHIHSYYEAEIEMLKYRLPQPDSKK